MKMKKLSLVKHNMIGNGGLGISCIIHGSAQLMGAYGLLGKNVKPIVSIVAMVCMLLCVLLLLKIKTDIWDETAREHYAEAHKIAFGLVHKILLVMTVVISALEGLQKAFTLRAGHVWIFYGFIHLLLWGCFAYVEKRDA